MKNTKQLQSFVKHMRLKNLSERTIKTYRSILIQFFIQVDEYVERINRIQIENYLLNIKNARTRNQTTGCIKSFFYFINRKSLCETIPYAKVPKYLPKIISKEQFDKGFNKITNAKHRLIVNLLFSHGMRLGEVINCRISWFGSQEIDGQKHYTLSITGKGSKDRVIMLSNKTANLLWIYSKTNGINLHIKDQYLFTGQNGKQYSSSSIRKITQNYFGVNPHALRHSCGTILFNRNTNLKAIKNQLGHSSYKTTDIYTHLSMRNMLGVCV